MWMKIVINTQRLNLTYTLFVAVPINLPLGAISEDFAFFGSLSVWWRHMNVMVYQITNNSDMMIWFYYWLKMRRTHRSWPVDANGPWWYHETLSSFPVLLPDSKVHGANMGPICGRQYPGGPMNFAIWVVTGIHNVRFWGRFLWQLIFVNVISLITWNHSKWRTRFNEIARLLGF